MLSLVTHNKNSKLQSVCILYQSAVVTVSAIYVDSRFWFLYYYYFLDLRQIAVDHAKWIGWRVRNVQGQSLKAGQAQILKIAQGRSADFDR